MSLSGSNFYGKRKEKDEYENFVKTNCIKENNEQDILKLKRELKKAQEERLKSENETKKLKCKINLLKTEEEKTIKKIQFTNKSIQSIESVRKKILENKINNEEQKFNKEQQLEIKKLELEKKRLQNKDFLKEWRIKLTIKKHEEKKELKNEKRKLIRKLNIEKQEDEEKNKQICIKVKTAKINFLDKKQDTIEMKKKVIKEEIIQKIQEEKIKSETIKEENSILITETNNMKQTIDAIDGQKIDSCKLIYYLVFLSNKNFKLAGNSSILSLNKNLSSIKKKTIGNINESNRFKHKVSKSLKFD